MNAITEIARTRDAEIIADRRRKIESAEAQIDRIARSAPVGDVSDFLLEIATSRMDHFSKLRAFLEQYQRDLSDHIHRPDDVDTLWLTSAFEELREELEG